MKTKKQNFRKHLASSGSIFDPVVEYHGTVKNNVFSCIDFRIELYTNGFWQELANMAKNKHEFIELYVL